MQDVYVISDTHFGHRNIIKYCNRPFDNVDQMNECIIEMWNATVKPNDVVFHLGDFSFTLPYHKSNDILGKLHGKKVLISGNHDDEGIMKSKHWSGVFHKYCLQVNGYKMHMRHFPWQFRALEDNEILLHGHTHNNPHNSKVKELNMSVEIWDYQPAHIEEIIEVWNGNSFWESV